MKVTQKAAGFTLIELVMVIVILGIVAAVAIPKFVDLSSDATTAKDAYNTGVNNTKTAIQDACLQTPAGKADNSKCTQ
jgi:MSHA pilin protein MshA